MGWGIAAVVAISAASAVYSYSEQRVAETKAENAAEAQASANRAAAEREDELLRMQAAQEEEAGQEEAAKIRENARRVKSAQTAGLGGAGVKIGEGTASDILMETDKLSELDALAALKDAGNRANLLKKRGGNLLATDWYMNPPIRTSSALATGLSIANTGLSGYSKYKGNQNNVSETRSSSMTSMDYAQASSGSSGNLLTSGSGK